MWKFKIFLVSIIVAVLIYSSQSVDLPKPSYTRTVLKVSRSLPGETEELKVRTSEGNLATLIVKRREKSPSLSANESAVTESSKVSQEQPVIVEQKDDINGSSSTQEEIKRRENAQIEEIKAQLSKYRDDSIEKKDSIDYGTWKPLGLVRVSEIATPTTTEEYLNWKPLTPLESKPVEQARINYDRWRKDDFFNPSSTLTNFQDGSRKELSQPENRSSKSVPYSFLPHQSQPFTRTNIGANLSINRNAKNVPPEVVIQSELNVKFQPKRSALSLDADGTPVIHGQRVPDEPIDNVQVWRNARVINNKLVQGNPSFTTIASSQADPLTTHPSVDKFLEKQKFDKFFDDVNRRFGRNFEDRSRNVYFEWDPKNYQNEALKAEVYEFRNDKFNPRSNLHKRMLHPDNYATYPDSRLYTTEAHHIAPVALKPGARAPVLQYAHPELGVQPAKILKNERRKPDNFPENQHSFTEQRHKKKYVLNDKNIIDTYNTRDYYPNQHFYGLKRPQDPPLWIKISENIKNQLSTGVEKVSEFTRPVFDPLVEATHKISKNLGLSRDNDNKVAEDKIGTVATAGSSMLLPALGWVASGAALGIGAVAVGRYLDVDVLKRSNDAAELRNLSPDQLYILETETPMPQVTDELVIKDSKQRNKRSLDGLDNDFTNSVRDQRLYQRKGADSISEIVEIDLPIKEGDRIDVIDMSQSSKRDENLEDAIIIVEEEGKETKEGSKSPTDETVLKKDEHDDKGSPEMFKSNDILNGERRIVESVKSRRKRSEQSDQELDDILQNLENAEVAEIAHIDGDWTNTPCAKRIFCDTMIQRGTDASIFMEKKMAALLALIQPDAAVQVSNHFQEVMDAVRRHDCSRFLCPQARPGNVFF